MKTDSGDEPRKDGIADKRREQDERDKLRFVLKIVLIICGGNGIGVLAGAFFWKYTGRTPQAVTLMVLITAAAFLYAVLLIKKRAGKNRK